MTGVVAADAADAVTAGTPLSARPASAAPMAMSIFLIVIISRGPAGDPPDVPVCLRLDGRGVLCAGAGGEQWVRPADQGVGARLLGVQLGVPAGDQRAQSGAGSAGHCGTAPHLLTVCGRPRVLVSCQTSRELRPMVAACPAITRFMPPASVQYVPITLGRGFGGKLVHPAPGNPDPAGPLYAAIGAGNLRAPTCRARTTLDMYL